MRRLLARRSLLFGLFGWRWHLLARYRCARGPVLYLFLRGEFVLMTPRERDLADEIERLMAAYAAALGEVR